MNRLAVMLLIIVQTARNPTPTTAAALTSKAHKPLTLMPHSVRMSNTVMSHNRAVMERAMVTRVS